MKELLFMSMLAMAGCVSVNKKDKKDKTDKSKLKKVPLHNVLKENDFTDDEIQELNNNREVISQIIT